MSAGKRRRSQSISLGLVGALAVAFAGCEDNDTAYCVDQTDTVVENRYCDEDDDDGNSTYLWYFGGSRIGSGAIARGAKLKGGERIATTNKAALAQRGGFGGSAKGGGVGRAVSGGGGSGGGS